MIKGAYILGKHTNFLESLEVWYSEADDSWVECHF